MQAILDKAILASRYILVVFFLGLAVGLAAYAVRFLWKLWKFVTGVLTVDDTRHLIDLLHLLDAALVASLVVIVAVSSYDSLVSRLADADTKQTASWVGSIDPSNLKLKLALALVAISSIHLLQIFMELDQYDDRRVTLAIILHSAFLIGVLVLGLVDKVGGKKG